MMAYLRENLGEAFRTSPFAAPLRVWVPLLPFAVIALLVGFRSGLLQPQSEDPHLAFVLPFTLFIFPALLEETFFRGLLIPRDILQRGPVKTIVAIAGSTLLFVAWHPFNALAFNQSAIPLFLDPWFLVIVAALGITCGYAYALSRSIWVPVLIHWATVLVWVMFLGGRNLVLQL